MIVQIQQVLIEQVMLSPNGLFVLHQIILPFKNFSIEFTWVSCFYLGYFKRWLHFFQGIPISTPYFKMSFLVIYIQLKLLNEV